MNGPRELPPGFGVRQFDAATIGGSASPDAGRYEVTGFLPKAATPSRRLGSVDRLFEWATYGRNISVLADRRTRSKSGPDASGPQSKTLRVCEAGLAVRQLLDCGSPLPLSMSTNRLRPNDLQK